jgi:hypothetical protein
LEYSVNLDSVLQVASSISSLLSPLVLALGYYFMVRVYREWIHLRQETHAAEQASAVKEHGLLTGGPLDERDLRIIRIPSPCSISTIGRALIHLSNCLERWVKPVMSTSTTRR